MSIRRERETKDHSEITMQTSLAEELQSWNLGEIDRREFLKRVAVVFAVSATLPVSLNAISAEEKLIAAEWREDPWWTLYEVQEHLFPHTEDAPGAKDIGATLYLKRELANPRIDREEADLIVKGVGWLNDLSEKNHKRRFVDLGKEKREVVLREIEQSRVGSRWLSLLIYYVIEALLSDPVYGGNPDGIGWKWLDHNPGFPRPTPDKTYSKL